jgi:hypothetical protein
MTTEKKLLVQIKGIRDGLLITLGNGEWPALLEALYLHIDEREAFFRGARVALEVGDQIIRAAEMGRPRKQPVCWGCPRGYSRLDPRGNYAQSTPAWTSHSMLYWYNAHYTPGLRCNLKDTQLYLGILIRVQKS